MRQAWETCDASTVIRLVRWNTDLSQTALARMTGLGQSTISEIISGKVELKHQDRINKVFEGFGVHQRLGVSTLAKPQLPRRSISTVEKLRPTDITKNLWRQVSQVSETEAVHILRRVDRQSIGVNLYTLVMRYLTSRVGPALLSEDGGPRTFIAAAGLTEMAGWMAHDTGHDQLATRHFQRALNLAQAAEDTTLAAQIWASRAHLALYRADTETALIASEQAWRNLDGGEDTALRGRVLAMLTRAHAARGDADTARTFLFRAEHLLSVPVLQPRSEWTSPFDFASLASEAARGLHDLRDHTGAAEHARHVLRLRPPERVRARSLASLTLVQALIGQEQTEEAASVVGQVAGSEAVKGSVVVATHLRAVMGKLGPHRKVPAVATVLQQAEESLAEVVRGPPAVEWGEHER